MMVGMNGYSELARRIRETVRRDPIGWARAAGVVLRPYQAEIALAIKDSVLHNRGLTFVVMLPRQSGKNEVQRHLFAWLMYRAAEKGGTIVSVAPTFKPQTINAMERTRQSLDETLVTRGKWRSSAGFIFRFHKARVQFFSGENTSKVVGATADLLLSVDEAQDIDPAKFDKEFDPMTASTNATRVFWGTAWTSQTLLARQKRMAEAEEKKDGIKRVFYLTGEDIARMVPEYGLHLERVVRERGRQHPLVRTQYFNEEIDAQMGMFNEGRMALMFAGGDFTTKDTKVSKEETRKEGKAYAFLLDVAGMDEVALRTNGERLGNEGRDSTTLSIVEIDLSSLKTLQAPTYRVVKREAWTGISHLVVFGQVKALAERWRPMHFVVDATGVGEGLWALLHRQFGDRVMPVKFTQQEKSEMGWRFLSIIETGRFRDAAASDTVLTQYRMVKSEILPGPGKTLRWGVPDGTRGPDGQLVHDDHVMADALMAKLDQLEWRVGGKTIIIQGKDPLEEMSRFR
jgi:hypothetical protein